MLFVIFLNFSICILTPSALNVDETKKNHTSHKNETLTHLELRKTFRRGKKNGNPGRSVSYIGPEGGFCLYPAGFATNFDKSANFLIYYNDEGTGHGKREQL